MNGNMKMIKNGIGFKMNKTKLILDGKEIRQTKIKTAKKKIRALPRNGPYSHNIVSCILRQIADDCGCGEADKLIDELNLDTIYGIHKEE